MSISAKLGEIMRLNERGNEIAVEVDCIMFVKLQGKGFRNISKRRKSNTTDNFI